MDFTCKGCSLSFKDQFAFFMHFFSNLCIAKQRESTEKENRTVLDVKHLRSNESNVCEVCGKFCWPFAGLAKHILTHVGAMPYFCPFCHFSSLSKLHLQLHISSHSSRAINGNQKFPSNLNHVHVCDSCNCAFTDWKDLAVHYVKHLKEAPFKCNICCMMFLEKDDFNIHRHLHKISPFCEFCQLSFNNRLDCLEHVLSHNKSKMFRKFSLVVPYERLMKLKTSWYHDFFSGPSICDQHLLDNSSQSRNFLTEENDSANFENQKDDKLLHLNYPSAQTVPSTLIDIDIKENVVHICEATLESRKKDKNICSLSEKPMVSDSLNCEETLERAINTFGYSNNLKISSENELNSDITCTSDVCAIETESTRSSVHPKKCSNTKQKFKTSDCLVRLPNYVQDTESCKNFSNVQSYEFKNFNKSWKEANFRSTILNKNSLVSENRSNDNKLQLSHQTLHRRAVANYDFYSMQFTSSHSKPMFDYSVHNNQKIDEVEIRENVSHLCEVIFEEGEEEISFNCGLPKKFIKCSTSKRTSEANSDLFKFSNIYETSLKRKLNGNITVVSADDQNNLVKVLNNNHNKQQLNFCKDANKFYKNESEQGVRILSSTAEEKFSGSTSDKANKINCLIDLVRNLKDVFVVLEKLPNYVHDMSSFRKYKNINNNSNKLSLAYQKDSKKSRLKAKNSIPQRVKKKNFKTNACSTFSDSSLFNAFTSSESSSSTDEMLHHSLGKHQKWKMSGTDKNKAYSKTKRTTSQSSVESIFQKSEEDSSTTESSETDSDSSSDISDFMHRWLLNFPKNNDSNSPNNTFSRTKKSVVKLCQKQPRKHSSQLQTSLNSVQMKKPFVHLWKLPDYIYEKHKKCEPIMLSSLPSMFEKTEYVFQKQQVTSQVLHDHNYCLPFVNCSFLVEHDYS
ncbi:uncharacterized protein LOC129976222 [Argiope bruennichi]|uniref:uncharacterized protein LOC129976222 n=1 Tax=Argiope bruennichi TaxID=94029 RepID=UPI002495A3A8|nr:uncharacterized protein LOC129976222 [Argiope bruennichi]XP_055945652.1 uncharacterized protein LOC129976222 [Argiope bruennichi]